MTNRQRVNHCLEFSRPDRVPRDVWTLPIAWQAYGESAMRQFCDRWPSDFAVAPGSDKLHALRRGDAYAAGAYRDEWGCEFENLQAGVIGEVKRPMLDDWSKLSALRPPVECLDIDIDAANRFCRATDKFVFGSVNPNPFERMQFLRGTENLMCDIADESAEFFALRDIVHGHYCKEMDVWASTEVDALKFADDWGSQRALLISPAKWRKLFRPMYEDYCTIARDSGKKVFMHSDGCIFDIYEDLIDMGVDAVNSQLFCMDIEEIGRRFTGRITFWGELDRQHILPHGSLADVRAAVRRVVDNLYRPEGGVIAQFELGPGGKLENAHMAFAAWDELTKSGSPRTA